ncbi:MAG TPA: leucine-rich repeat domain-containing protein [Bacilli bacterium]|nr:leucine-rich repeat domain-containing protein [Bacilli bacterium]
MSNKIKGILIILGVIIVSSSLLIVYNYYSESPTKNTSHNQDVTQSDEDKDSNTTIISTTTSDVSTTTTAYNNETTTVGRVVRRTTRRTTTTVTTTQPQVQRTLLASGDITKEGTNGSVTYYYYDDGTFEVKGTGDGIMKSLVYNEEIQGFDAFPIIFEAPANLFWQEIDEMVIDGEKVLKVSLENLLPEVKLGLFQVYMIYGNNTSQKLVEFLIQSGAEQCNNQETCEVYATQITDILFGEGKGIELYNKLNIDFKLPDSIVIDNGVKEIGDGMFGLSFIFGEDVPETVYIKNIQIGSGLENIGVGAFLGDRIPELVLPNSIITIKNAAFAYNNLKELVIPNNVTLIGSQAFANNQLTELTIGSSLQVTGIGIGIFSGNQFTKITVLGDNETRFNGSWEAMGLPLEYMPD